VSAWLSNLFWKGPQLSLWAGQIFPAKARENSKKHSRQSILSKRKDTYTFQQIVEKNMKSEKQITV
jgi:hypothetical protein